MIRKSRYTTLLFVLAVAALLGFGCSDDDGSKPVCTDDFCLDETPKLEVKPSSQLISVPETGMKPGDSVESKIQIINVGEDVLKVTSAELVYQIPEGADDEGSPAFQLVQPLFTFPADVNIYNSDDYPQAVEFSVSYTKKADGIPREAKLVIGSNDPTALTVEVVLRSESGAPQLTTDKPQVDFKLVPKDQKTTDTLRLLNLGSVTLAVSGFEIKADNRFSVSGPGFDIGGSPDANFKIDLEEAIAVPPGGSVPIDVSFASDAPTPAEGKLLIFSNDPTSGIDGFEVPLIANKSGPCILVDPREVSFGGKTIGALHTIDVDITSCGTEPLSLKSLTLRDDSSPDFGIDFSGLPEGFETDGPTAANPLEIPVNESVTVKLTFVPDEINPVDADNIPIPDEGTLVVSSNAFEDSVEVPIEGAGAEEECPKAVIKVLEGEEVIPQTVLHLDASQSYASFGGISKYSWSVDQPDGNQQNLVPSSTNSHPVLAANVVGVYTFTLDVWDDNGIKSCEPAVYTVVVKPDKAIHVELTWTTPGDEDETDTGHGKGTDLDLHFTHAQATGPDLDQDGNPDPWFDEKWDCFWHNPEPDWASFDPAADDDPVLDRDDTDGAGPENLYLAVPQDNSYYRIGVHYWAGHAYGDVVASVRVYSYDQLIYEILDVPLKERDMWCVGDVSWPNPAVTPCKEDQEGEWIVPDYVNPFFFTP